MIDKFGGTRQLIDQMLLVFGTFLAGKREISYFRAPKIFPYRQDQEKSQIKH
jgi:hypothetical protein